MCNLHVVLVNSHMFLYTVHKVDEHNTMCTMWTVHNVDVQDVQLSERTVERALDARSTQGPASCISLPSSSSSSKFSSSSSKFSSSPSKFSSLPSSFSSSSSSGTSHFFSFSQREVASFLVDTDIKKHHQQHFKCLSYSKYPGPQNNLEEINARVIETGTCANKSNAMQCNSNAVAAL